MPSMCDGRSCRRYYFWAFYSVGITQRVPHLSRPGCQPAILANGKVKEVGSTECFLAVWPSWVPYPLGQVWIYKVLLECPLSWFCSVDKKGVSEEERCRLNCTDSMKLPEHPLLPAEDLCIWRQAFPVCCWTWMLGGQHWVSPILWQGS